MWLVYCIFAFIEIDQIQIIGSHLGKYEIVVIDLTWLNFTSFTYFPQIYLVAILEKIQVLLLSST